MRQYKYPDKITNERKRRERERERLKMDTGREIAHQGIIIFLLEQ